MSNLKDLTWEHHKNAERQEFASLMMGGKMHPDLYATYLWNQHKKYDILEAMAVAQGLLAEVGVDIRRKTAMEADIAELWKHDKEPLLVASTIEYLQHMRSIMTDRESLIAHMYVFYLGDLSGGQMIKRKIPGEGRMYDFPGDTKELKEKIKNMTNDDMAEEAKFVFDSATKLFQELMELDLEHTLEPSDTVSE
jgi:heme oxygenase (biliverdin-producing, ferredoxin)